MCKIRVIFLHFFPFLHPQITPSTAFGWVAARNVGKCGVIFEKKECDDGLIGTGDEKAIEEGRWINLRGTGFHEDVESILVAPGCVMFGYDENSKTDRGTGISVSAVGKHDWVYRELSSHRFVSISYVKPLNQY